MNHPRRVAPPVLRGENHRFLLLFLGAAWTAVQPVAAQQTVFSPTLMIEEARSGNVAYLGSNENEFRSDWITRLGLRLFLQREGRGGQAGMQYAGYLERYKTNSVLDHHEHMLGVNLASPAMRSSRVAFDAAYAYGQAQGNPGSLQSADLFLSQRTTRQGLRANLYYDWRGAGPWTFGTVGWASKTWFDQISGVPQGPQEAAVENRKEYGATVTLERARSALAKYGWVYGFTRYDLQLSGREDVHTLAMTFSLPVGRNGTVSFQVGGFQRSGTTQPGQPSTTSGGLQARAGLGLTRTGRKVSVGINADRNASSGGSLQGTSTDTTLSVRVDDIQPGRWFWSAAARYALREPTDPQLSRIQTVAGGGTLERRWRERARCAAERQRHPATEQRRDTSRLDDGWGDRAGLEPERP